MDDPPRPSSETTRYGEVLPPPLARPADPDATWTEEGEVPAPSAPGAEPSQADATQDVTCMGGADATTLDGALPESRGPASKDATLLSDDGSTRLEDETEAPQGPTEADATFSATLERAPPRAPADPDATGVTYDGAEAVGPRITDGGAEGWQVGATVDGLVLEDKRGEGGMGVVFAAREVSTGARFALKTLSLQAAQSLRDRFVREGEALAKVAEHPNVVRVHRAGEFQGRLYLLMDLVEGGDLKARIARNGPMGWRDACGLVAGLCRGMAYVHAQGILHRDLKPANVMFDAHGEPKLVDFGIARVLGEHSLTATSAFLGSPPYMSPELAHQRPKEVDARTDVYGLGAILFHALTGLAPYSGPSAMAIAKLVREEPPPCPSAHAADTPPGVDAVVARAMAKDPDERYRSADALREALEAVLAGEGGAPPRGARWAVAGGIVALAALAAAIGVAASSTTPPPPEPGAVPARVEATEADPTEEPSLARLLERAAGRSGPERVAAYRALRRRFPTLEGRDERQAARVLRELRGQVLARFDPPESGHSFRHALPEAATEGRFLCRFGRPRWQDSVMQVWSFEEEGGGAVRVPTHGVKPNAMAVWANDPAGPSAFFLDRSGLVWVDVSTGARLGPGRASSAEERAWVPPDDAVPTPIAGEIPDGDWFLMALSPDGRSLALGGANARVEILAVPSLERIGRTEPHERAFGSLSWSPNGRLLATASGRGPEGTGAGAIQVGPFNTVRVWTRAGERRWDRGAGTNVESVAFLSNTCLAIGGSDYTVQTRELVPGSSPVPFGSKPSFAGMSRTDHHRPVELLAVLDERHFVSSSASSNANRAGPNELGVWDVRQPRAPLVWLEIPWEIVGIALSADRDALLVGVSGQVEVVALPPEVE